MYYIVSHHDMLLTKIELLIYNDDSQLISCIAMPNLLASERLLLLYNKAAGPASL